jgi:xanthine dehydrogenase small subunit
MDAIELELNGQRIVERTASPTTTLLAWIRQRGLTGTKEGCAEGDCGACTVAILEEEGTRRFRAVNACLMLLPMVHGKKIWTVEGLETAGQLHPVQEALVHELGSQCGYCTPGVVMSMFEACYRGDLVEPHQLDDQMCGNLCRCTGYRPIRDAARAVAGRRPSDRFLAALSGPTWAPASLSYAAAGQRFFLPRTEAELIELLGAQAGARIVAGGTDLALEVTKRFEAPPLLISLDGISSLAGCVDRGDHVFIGATTRLSDLETFARPALPAVERMLRYFGSRQIKHRATVGGNLVNASPIGDLPPVFLAQGATVHTLSAAGRRAIDIDDFFVGYRRTALLPQEIVTGSRPQAPRPAS